jgi:sugar phosphate isomerase/epimerase
MSILSLAALTILDAGPAGQIKAAAAAGFQSVGLRLNPLLKSDPVIAGIGEREREIEELIANYKMKVLEIGVFPLMPSTDPEALKPVLALSQRLGARFLVCPVEDADLQRRAATYSHLCELAAAYDLDCLIEFNPYSACPNLVAAIALVASCKSANKGLVIDALHLSRSGGDPEDLRTIDPDWLKLVHLCDATPKPEGLRSIEEMRAESRTARLLPGEGSLWLNRLMAALPTDVGVSIEAPSARNAHLSATERASLAFAASSAFLSSRFAK